MKALKKNELPLLLNEAIAELEEAINAFKNKDEKTLQKKVWKAASDIEYATFLMALSRNNEDNGWKKQWKISKDLDIVNTLTDAQKLLKAAVESNNNKEKAYRNSWFARGQILNVQKTLDKIRTKRFYPQRPL